MVEVAPATFNIAMVSTGLFLVIQCKEVQPSLLAKIGPKHSFRNRFDNLIEPLEAV